MLTKKDGEYVLVSKTDNSKVLKKFGKKKPSKEAVEKRDRQIDLFARGILHGK